ncbi:MAG TPA: hypothetical protein VLE43_06430, partial [Candidatus Saccharimonadia bacterium]|nr:hypothetical protein [Candidatus Saccharimonadia bacterium]
MNSPFTPFTPAASGRTELTVGDILPGLPPEAANSRQVSPSQPLHLADEVVDRALASGHAALPLFEIYRVCPALFQTPISPEDKRTVPIPPHKIASLIPVKGNPAAALPGAGASPFAVASPATVHGFGGGAPTSLFSPFVQAEPPAGEPSDSTTLFHPSPFGFGPAASEPPPRPEQSPAAMSSPFGLAQPSPGPEAGQGSLAPGVPNPFAPSSAATFSAMAFGAPAPAPVPAPAPTPASAPGPLGGSSPFSFGAPAAPPPTYPAAPPPASAPELPATPSPFA